MLVAGVIAAQTALALIPPADSPLPVVGEPLRHAIDRFHSLNVFSSTRLLPRRLTVQALPDPNASPRTQIRELLEPHGLTLVMTDANTGYVAAYDVPEEPPLHTKERASVADPFIEEVVVYAPVPCRALRKKAVIEPAATQPDSERRRRYAAHASGPAGHRLRRPLSAMHRIRGGDTNEVLYRLDGVDQYEPFHFADAYSLFSAVNPNVVDSVDVYVSGFPSRFGRRMSGVVDLHLVEPERAVAGHRRSEARLPLRPTFAATGATGRGWGPRA